MLFFWSPLSFALCLCALPPVTLRRPAVVFTRLRDSALSGLPVLNSAVVPKRKRSRPGAPEISPTATVYATEPMVSLLHDEAALWWRRCSPSWAPSLYTLSKRSDLELLVTAHSVEVRAPHATWRAVSLPRPWVPVITAVLTHRELSPLRRALRASPTVLLRQLTQLHSTQQ